MRFPNIRLPENTTYEDEFKRRHNLYLAAKITRGWNLEEFWDYDEDGTRRISDITPSELRDDKQFVLDQVSANGKRLEFVNDVFKNDKDIVLAAVSQYGHSADIGHMYENGKQISFASEKLQNDLEVVKKAIKHNFRAWSYLKEGNVFKTDPSIFDLASNVLIQELFDTRGTHVRALTEDIKDNFKGAIIDYILLEASISQLKHFVKFHVNVWKFSTLEKAALQSRLATLQAKERHAFTLFVQEVGENKKMIPSTMLKNIKPSENENAINSSAAAVPTSIWVEIFSFLQPSAKAVKIEETLSKPRLGI